MAITASVRSSTWDAVAPEADAVALLLHGYGSHEQDLPGLAPWLPEDLPWISPRAPLAVAGAGFSWFPLDLPHEPDPRGIADATDELWEWIGAELPQNASLVPVGFSQGGLMALQLLRTRPERVAATVVLAGFVGVGEQPADARLAAVPPPVFWGRGDADPVIWPAAIARTAAFVDGHADATVRVHRGLGHGVHGPLMEDVRAFLDAAL